MALNNILSVFLPKDKVFYSLFEQTAANITEMGVLLHQFVYETDPNNRLAISKQIEDYESCSKCQNLLERLQSPNKKSKSTPGT